MEKLLKYIVVVCSIFIIVFVAFKYFNKSDKANNLNNETNTNQKVFEDPESIVYQIKGKEKFTLTKEDEEYGQILDKLKSLLGTDYTSKDVAFKEMGRVKLSIVDIQKEIYLENSVLRLLYSDTYEIDIIFGEDNVLDIIYIEDEKTDCFHGFKNNDKEELRKFIDTIIK